MRLCAEAAARKSTCLRHNVSFFVPSPYPYGRLFPSRESRLISLSEIGRVGVRHRRVRSLGYRDDKLDLSRTVGVEATGPIQTILVAFPTIRSVTFFLLVLIKPFFRHRSLRFARVPTTGATIA